jgi:hypothetical protein
MREPSPLPSVTVVPAAGPFFISGAVVDGTSGQPVRGATVEWAGLAEAWGDRGDGVNTDNNGKYLIRIGSLGTRNAPPPEILMHATFAEISSDTRQVALLQEQTTVNFSLAH